MGQGNIKYRKVKRTPQTGENAGKELWYATFHPTTRLTAAAPYTA